MPCAAQEGTSLLTHTVVLTRKREGEKLVEFKSMKVQGLPFSLSISVKQSKTMFPFKPKSYQISWLVYVLNQGLGAMEKGSLNGEPTCCSCYYRTQVDGERSRLVGESDVVRGAGRQPAQSEAAARGIACLTHSCGGTSRLKRSTKSPKICFFQP